MMSRKEKLWLDQGEPAGNVKIPASIFVRSTISSLSESVPRATRIHLLAGRSQKPRSYGMNTITIEDDKPGMSFGDLNLGQVLVPLKVR